jgi:CheY-like chemotaxis protein
MTNSMPPVRTRPRVVLLVDDNEDTKAMYAQSLEASGFSPLHVRSPLDGLKAAREFQPEAIVTALMFPGPLDGLALTRQLRLDARTAHLKIIILTGRAFTTDREAARRAGCDLFLTKPCAPGALVEALGKVGTTPVAPPPPAAETFGLSWSKRGEVACPSHAPARDSDRWTAESWRLIPPSVVHGRVRYQCQHCASGPIAHARRRPSGQVNPSDQHANREHRHVTPANGSEAPRDPTGHTAPVPDRAHLAPKV